MSQGQGTVILPSFKPQLNTLLDEVSSDNSNAWTPFG